MASIFLYKAFSLLCALVIANAQALPRPDGISDEMYCLGCEVTLKELDLMLRRKPTRGMGETVTRALSRVCDLNNFKNYNFDIHKIFKVCEHIKKDEGLEAVLIADYGRKHATGLDISYLDIIQKVCVTHLKACKSGETLGDQEGGGISYDPETEEIKVRDGAKVRKVDPVREDSPPEKKVDPKFDSLDKKAPRPHMHQEDSHDEL